MASVRGFSLCVRQGIAAEMEVLLDRPVPPFLRPVRGSKHLLAVEDAFELHRALVRALEVGVEMESTGIAADPIGSGSKPI